MTPALKKEIYIYRTGGNGGEATAHIFFVRLLQGTSSYTAAPAPKVGVSATRIGNLR